MNNRQIVLLLVAVLAIGIFALPSTIAMFGGQHNWYDLGDDGNQVPCEKCHADIYDEMSNTGPHSNMSCWYCHRTSNLTGYTYASGDGTGSLPGEEAHAASTVECMDCHEGFAESDDCATCHDMVNSTITSHPTEWIDDAICGDCHLGYSGGVPHGASIEAGGFNLTVTSDDTGTNAAHMAFVQDADADPLMEGANEACITCHTHTAIDINWTHAYKMSLNAVQDEDGNWDCTDFITEGTYNVTTYGNMSGETTGVTDPVIVIDPEPEGYDSGNP